MTATRDMSFDMVDFITCGIKSGSRPIPATQPVQAKELAPPIDITNHVLNQPPIQAINIAPQKPMVNPNRPAAEILSDLEKLEPGMPKVEAENLWRRANYYEKMSQDLQRENAELKQKMAELEKINNKFNIAINHYLRNGSSRTGSMNAAEFGDIMQYLKTNPNNVSMTQVNTSKLQLDERSRYPDYKTAHDQSNYLMNESRISIASNWRGADQSVAGGLDTRPGVLRYDRNTGGFTQGEQAQAWAGGDQQQIREMKENGPKATGRYANNGDYSRNQSVNRDGQRVRPAHLK